MATKSLEQSNREYHSTETKKVSFEFFRKTNFLSFSSLSVRIGERKGKKEVNNNSARSKNTILEAEERKNKCRAITKAISRQRKRERTKGKIKASLPMRFQPPYTLECLYRFLPWHQKARKEVE
jgi:hypothetical protein